MCFKHKKLPQVFEGGKLGEKAITLRGPTFLRGRILRRSARRPGLDLSILYSCGTAPELNRTSLDTTPLGLQTSRPSVEIVIVFEHTVKYFLGIKQLATTPNKTYNLEKFKSFKFIELPKENF
jgi:hypothetical protein